MTRQEVDNMIQESQNKSDATKEKIIAAVNQSDLFTEEHKHSLTQYISSFKNSLAHVFESTFSLRVYMFFDQDEKNTGKTQKDLRDFLVSIRPYFEEYREIDVDEFERYIDSDSVEFDGDIIITDPCYIVRAEHHGTKPITEDDWAACDYGSCMEALGIHEYISRDTLCGDWNCTTYNSDTGEVIGEFCADSGMVSVLNLEEVLQYNPEFNYHLRTWTTTWIEDFKGTVQFVVRRGGNVEVVGRGINKRTGCPLNFVGKQTGL